MKVFLIRFSLLVVLLLYINCTISAQFIKPYNESASHFNTPTIIDTSRGKFPSKDMYRAFRKASTGFTTMSKTQKELEQSI